MARDPSGRRGVDRYGRGQAPIEYTKAPQTDDEALDERRSEFADWDEATADDRELQENDRDFYDGIQWTDEEVDQLNARGQPIITKNRIAPKVNYVLGTETESRVDPRAYPRTMHHELDSEAVTDALRYKADENKFDQIRSAVAQNMLIEGYGGAVFSAEGEEFELTHVPWDRIYYDPHSRRSDFGDAWYVGVYLWMYREELEASYPDKADLVEQTYSPIGLTLSTDDRPSRWWSKKDNRVRVFETYYKGVVGEGAAARFEWFTCKWSYAGFLEEPRIVDFADEHGRTWCPMIITSGFITRENSRYGIVRNMISPQEEINKRSSKALHQIHTTRVMAETGAVHSPDEFQAQMARPDGYAEVAPGRLRDGSIQPIPNTDLAAAQLGMLEQAKQEIDQIGPHAALVAADQRQQSGRLFIARQQAGTMELKPVFDHLKQWTLDAYRRYWWLIRQRWTNEKWIRVRDNEGEVGYRFVALNREMTRGERLVELMQDHGHELDMAVAHVMGPLGKRLWRQIQGMVQQQNQAMQQRAQQLQQQGQPVPPFQPLNPLGLLLETDMAKEVYTSNELPALDVDLVLDTVPESAIIQHEQFTELVELVKMSPTLAQNPQVVKAIIEASSLRDKQKLISLLDPPKDPQQEQMAQMQMQQMQAQMAAQMEMMKAQIAKLQADAQKSTASAQKTQAEAQLVPLEAQQTQAETALIAAQAKQAGAIATRDAAIVEESMLTGLGA
jgi:hypothetical protein